jgi:hypothetical protein
MRIIANNFQLSELTSFLNSYVVKDRIVNVPTFQPWDTYIKTTVNHFRYALQEEYITLIFKDKTPTSGIHKFWTSYKITYKGLWAGYLLKQGLYAR